MQDQEPQFDLASLRREFVHADLTVGPTYDDEPQYLDLMIVRKEQVRLKIYQEKGHARPHFHIDYGSQPHAATYAIDSGERLEGNLDRRYDRAVSSWISQNREALFRVWSAVQVGRDPIPFIQTLSAL